MKVCIAFYVAFKPLRDKYINTVGKSMVSNVTFLAT